MDDAGHRARLTVRLLGRFEIAADDRVAVDQSWPRRKAQALVKLLALRPGRALHREALLDALWPEMDITAASNNLRQTLHHLRTALNAAGAAPDLIAASGNQIALAPGVTVDVDEFRVLAARARSARSDAALYEQALDLYAGDLLPDDPYEPWTERPREELHALYLQLLFELSRVRMARGEPERAAACLDRLLGADPAHEEAHRALMHLYAETGARHRALRQYEKCVDALERELGVEPSEETQAVYRAISAGHVRAPAGAATSGGMFVGREREMDELRRYVDEALDGQSRVVLIAGEPGIGKTRTAEELATYARLRGAAVLWGRCYESEGAPPFWPWRQAVRLYLEGGGSLELDAASRPLAAEIARLLPELRDGLGNPTPGGLAVDSEEARFRLFDAVASLAKSASRSRALFVVIDDLQGADTSSLRLMAFLARELRAARILLVGTFRDVELRDNHPLAQAIADMSREPVARFLTLQGLRESDIGRFMEATAEIAPPAALVNAVFRETGGNPFFMTEIVNLLRAQGRLDGAGATRADIEIPMSVREVIGRRVDRLSPACGRILSMASIMGREFSPAVLGRLSALPINEVSAALAEATGARVLVEAPALESGPRYRFVHSLIPETLRARLSPAARQELHASAGEALVTLYDADLEAHITEIAYHFCQAGRLGGDIERAIEYALRAGEAAQRTFAWEETTTQWETALELMELGGVDIGRRAALLEELHDVMFRTGSDYAAGLKHLDRALAIRERLGQMDKVAQLHYRLGIARSIYRGDAAYLEFMDIPRALEHYRTAKAIFDRGPDGPIVGYFHVFMAVTAYYALRVEEALGASSRAMNIAEQSQAESLWGTAAGLHGILLKLTGQLARGRELLEQCWEAADKSNDLLVAFFSATNIADWYEGYACGRGDIYRRELQKPRIANAERERAGLSQDLGASLCLNGELAEARRLLSENPSPFLSAMIAYCDGDWAEAEAGWLQDYEMFARAGNRSTHSARSYQLGELYYARGDMDRAEAALMTAIEPVLDGHCPLIEMRVRPRLALLLAQGGRLAQAKSHLKRCRTILARGEEWGVAAGRVTLAEGVLAAREDRDAKANTDLRSAVRIFEERFLPWETADALVQWGRILIAADRSEDARTKLDQAHAVYQRIGAGRAWHDRVEDAAHTPIRPAHVAGHNIAPGERPR